MEQNFVLHLIGRTTLLCNNKETALCVRPRENQPLAGTGFAVELCVRYHMYTCLLFGEEQLVIAFPKVSACPCASLARWDAK